MKKLDLHGVLHEDVPELVHRFINSNWKPDQELHIITGHSQRMKSIVTGVLRLYDVTVEHGTYMNPGFIRVFT